MRRVNKMINKCRKGKEKSIYIFLFKPYTYNYFKKKRYETVVASAKGHQALTCIRTLL